MRQRKNEGTILSVNDSDTVVRQLRLLSRRDVRHVIGELMARPGWKCMEITELQANMNPFRKKSGSAPAKLSLSALYKLVSEMRTAGLVTQQGKEVVLKEFKIPQLTPKLVKDLDRGQ